MRYAEKLEERNRRIASLPALTPEERVVEISLAESIAIATRLRALETAALDVVRTRTPGPSPYTATVMSGSLDRLLGVIDGERT